MQQAIWCVALKDCKDGLSGGGGIRTPGTRESTTDFKSAAFDHSATPPAFGRALIYPVGRVVERDALFMVLRLLLDSNSLCG